MGFMQKLPLFAALILVAKAAPALEAVPKATPCPPSQVENPVPIYTGLVDAETAQQILEARRLGRRDLLDKFKNEFNSLLGGLPSYVLSGVPAFFQDFPTGSNVIKSAGISTSDLDALPTQVLNIPPYANWSNNEWNIRFRGNVYKLPDISQEKIDDLANVFLIDTSVKDLPPDQQANARNLTRSIYVVQQGDVNVTMHLEPAPLAGGDGEQNGGGGIPAPGGSQDIKLPYPTTPEGDFDVFVPIKNVSGGGLLAGSETEKVQKLNIYANGSDIGNATAYLVPPQGVTFVSDIDDILRVTKIYKPKEGLLNSFARNFTPWMNMPDIYRTWSEKMPNAHFHYLTTTPEQATRNYMDFIYKTYPGGSFDTRPLNFSDIEATLSIRKSLLEKVIETFPQRKFVLIADTSNSDVMKDYPLLAKEHKNVVCIFLRNTSSTDNEDKFPYDTKGFEGLNQQSYMFFNVPDDLMNLDIENGKCLNASIKQNVTFGLQDEALGIHGAASRVSGASFWSLTVALAAAFFLFL